MSISFIHTADIHIGKKFDTDLTPQESKVRRRELWETFDKIIELCIRNRVEFLFIAGDMTEAQYCKVEDIVRLVAKFEEAKETQVVIVPGNKDPWTTHNLYKYMSWPPNVHWIDETNQVKELHFEDKNLCVYSIGISSMEQPNKRDCLYDVDVDVNRINVLLIHADVLEKDSGALRVDLNRISGKFDYVALGHVHQYAEIRDRIIYPGTPEPLDFTEKGQHGVVYGRLGKDNFEKMFVPVAKSRFITKEIFLQPEFSSEKILDIIKYSGDYISASKDYFKIILTGSVNSGIDMDRLLNEASNYFQHIGFEENYLYDIHSDQLPERQEDSLIGQYIKQYQEKGLKTLEMQKSFLLGLNLLMESKERSDDH